MASSKTILAVWMLEILVQCIFGEFVLRIAHTNDVHARFEEFDRFGGSCEADEECFGGVARRHTAVQQLKNEAGPNFLFLDAGDHFQGTLWFSYYLGNATAYFMNKLQYDVMVLGNHEFDRGVEGLRPFLQSAQFSVISSNIDPSDEPLVRDLFTPSVVKIIDGRKIGIVGYTTRKTPDLVFPGGVTNLKFEDEITKVREEVNRLRNEEGVKIIIALGHAGYPKDLELAAAVTGVDIVVGGHTDTFLYSGTPPSAETPVGPYPTVVTQESGSQALVVQAFTFGKYLGYLEVTFDDDGNVINYEGNPILLNESYSQDSEVLADIQTWKAPIANLTEENIGNTNVLLNGSRESCRTKECNMGNMITDALVYYFMTLSGSTPDAWAHTSIALWNSGAIRASIAQGDISVDDVLRTVPFNNGVERIEISGQTLLDGLKHAVEEYNPLDPPGGFLQMSGLKVTYDVSTTPFSVVDVQVRCLQCLEPSFSPLRLDQTYAVLMSQYLIEGGDGYVMFRDNRTSRLRYDLLESDIVINHIKLRSPIFAQVDGRIKFANSTTTITTTECENSSVPPMTLNILSWLISLTFLCVFKM